VNGGLQVHEVRDRGQRAVELRRRQFYRQRGLGRDHRRPGRRGIKPAEDPIRPAAQQLGQRRIELPARPPARQRGRPRHAAHAVRHLHELGELGDPGRDRYRVGLQRARPAVPVPLLVRRADRLPDHIGQPELLGQRPRQPGMLGNHPVELAMPGNGELEPDPEPVQRRVAGADQPHGRQRAAHASQLVGVLTGLERDVIAEPLRLLMRVSVTAHVDQQRGVVNRHPVLLTQPGLPRQPQRDQALPQHMLHRLPEPQVYLKRQRRHQLRQPCTPIADNPSHQPILTAHLSHQHLSSQPR
jgi:hypothetical protein